MVVLCKTPVKGQCYAKNSIDSKTLFKSALAVGGSRVFLGVAIRTTSRLVQKAFEELFQNEIDRTKSADSSKTSLTWDEAFDFLKKIDPSCCTRRKVLSCSRFEISIL